MGHKTHPYGFRLGIVKDWKAHWYAPNSSSYRALVTQDLRLLVTRGIVEMARFGAVHGAQSDTFFGLAGIGDLVTTCYSRHSRNRSVGESIGRGKTLEEILTEMQMVAEGVWTTKALFGPESEARGVRMPIAEQVHAVLFEKKDPHDAVIELMRREPTREALSVGELDG